MSNTFANDAFLAYSKVQSLLKDGFEHGVSSENIEEFEYENDISVNLTDENRIVMSPADVVKANVHHEIFPLTLRASEDLFQEMLQDNMKKYSDCIAGVVAEDGLQSADIASRYAAAVGHRHFELDRKADSVKTSDSTLRRDALQEKAERDLWTLLEILSRSNLLDDIDDEQCETNLQSIISSLPVTASIPDFVNAAYEHDSRIRKGEVLKEWIEQAAADKIEVAPAPHAIPGNETLSRILKTSQRGNKSKDTASLIQSMHPDAQLTADGLLLSLDGIDRLDQEALLKSIFFLIRSGQILKAQQLAAEHRVFWLAASLQGVASHYHNAVEFNDENNASAAADDDAMNQENNNIVGITRLGNPSLPIWTRSCWKHASRLSAHPGNWNAQAASAADLSNKYYDDMLFGLGSQGNRSEKTDSLVGTLECSIYAALSNNTKVLLESSLLTSWHDKVWVLLKASHERDLTKVIHRYRCLKSAHSSLYPGCDTSVIAAERELLDLSKLEIGHMSTGNCTQIFNRVPPPKGINAQSMLLTLQAAVMEGKSGIAHFIEQTMVPLLNSKPSEETFQGLSVILRVFCHFAIWLKYSPANGPLCDLVSDEVLYLTIEQYINYLIGTKQYTLIAAYAAYLNRPRRIAKYCELLRVIRTSAEANAPPESIHEPSGQSGEAAEVLQLASIFFPLDVMDIARSVVEGSQVITVQRVVTASSVVYNGRSVHFSETDGAGLPVNEAFASIKGHEATPGILRSRVSEPESPSITSHKPIASISNGTNKTVDNIDNKEVTQMESLRWLFFDPSHRLEAVKQTNKLITNFLTESTGTKLTQVRILLTEYLPYNSVTVGYSILKQRVMDVEDEVNDCMAKNSQQQNSEQFNETVSALKDSLQLDQLCWEANVCKLELWKSLVGAMENFDTFKNLLIEYSSAASRMVGSQTVLRSSLGKYRSKIEQAATTAVEALTRTIVCSPYSTDYENPAEGYKDIWMKSDSAIMSSVIHLISDLKTLILEYHPTKVSLEDNTATLHSIREEANEAIYLSTNFFADHDDDSQAIHELVSSLSQLIGECPVNDSDCLLKVSTAVNQVKLNLLDYKESIYLRSLLINKLLSAYLQVCVECGTAMETLEHPQEAATWYYKAIKLANLIASEEYSLQLETLLNRNDLESLLSTINKASIKVLKIDPDFNIV